MNVAPNFTQASGQRLLFGLPVYDLTFPGALALVNELAAQPAAQAHISFLNANNANIMFTDPQYRAILGQHMVFPDGIGIDIASLVLSGHRFSANLNGTDFVPAMLTYIEKSLRVGLIGGQSHVLATAAERFRRHSPWHEFIEISDGYFDMDNSEAVIAKLESSNIDILLIGLGTPLQEKWIDTNIRKDHARLVIGVGALFDFVSGNVPRAPYWVRRVRGEWIYRLWLEPRRLWRRYLLGNPTFLLSVLRYRLGGQPAAATATPATAPQKLSIPTRSR
ncbi:MAG: WecB/TagA/CpsF family glycosyltransferase [Allorhizobium sp.]